MRTTLVVALISAAAASSGSRGEGDVQGDAAYNKKTLRSWWNKADTTFSHISYNRWLQSEANLIKLWRRLWLDRLPAEPGHVADYGIGAGLLGQLVLNETRASRYTGIDVSDRQLEHAEKRLASCCAGRYSLVRTDALTSAHLDGVQTFVSQAVIQHFPSHEYLRNFLSALEGAPSVRWAHLQVRERTPDYRKPGAADGNDGSMTSVTWSLSVSPDELAAALSSFRLVYSSPRQPNGYVSHVFERKPG